MFLYSGIQSVGPLKSLYTSPPSRPVLSKAISISLESIQPRCNYAKTIRSHFHHCLYCHVLIYTAELTVARWGDQTCQRFEAIAVGFETGFSLLRIRHSNRYAIAPHIRVYSVHICLWLYAYWFYFHCHVGTI